MHWIKRMIDITFEMASSWTLKRIMFRIMMCVLWHKVHHEVDCHNQVFTLRYSEMWTEFRDTTIDILINHTFLSRIIQRYVMKWSANDSKNTCFINKPNTLLHFDCIFSPPGVNMARWIYLLPVDEFKWRQCIVGGEYSQKRGLHARLHTA